MKDLFNKTLIASIIIHILMFTHINVSEKIIEFESLIPVLVGLITMLIVFRVSNFTKMNFIKKQYVSWFGYGSGYCLGFLYFIIISL
ncbi:hypothetical protein [uncultured Clostridium sp.]|uniref:hypothetical protein n=1 Tax=uncultured Clostridium sp. TaxID=59620 RepID=UPI00260ED4BE|nr:hypothetical protein [uncultured Clostridium sp.]